ncbi:MAG: M56 family metallopeptidase [Flavipsychrobacter sp.]|nr:M56 family metallopeptidase [Flavipsychrobacter sp.]
MAIWIQSLSWTLIYSLGQGFVVYASLWLFLKLLPVAPAHVKYNISLSALAFLFAWFAATWWQQFHVIALVNEHPFVSGMERSAVHPLVMDTTASYGWQESLFTNVIAALPWLSAFYLAGLALMLVRLSGGMLQLFTLKNNAVIQPEATIEVLLQSLKNKLHFEGRVELLISAKAQVPMVIGVLKPIILMPAAAIAQLSTEQLGTIIMHELAHIERHDYLVNIFQTVVETILFFNPFTWMISSIIRREREHCCDDLVVHHTSEPLIYATALATLAASPGPHPNFSVAATGQTHHLFNRIKRIMEMKKNQFSYSRMVAAIVIISGIACSLAWIRPSFPQPEKEKPTEASTAATAVKNVDSTTNMSEEIQLVQQLEQDGLINQLKGFVVEKNQHMLFIDGSLIPDKVASKYIARLTKDQIWIQVYPFAERLKQHPNAGFLQNLLPVMLTSPCVDYKPKKKPGC